MTLHPLFGDVVLWLGGHHDLVFVLVILIGAILAGIYASILAGRRRKSLIALAGRLGLTFKSDEDHGLARQFEFINALAHGSNRYAFNVLSGKYRQSDVLIFDYRYEIESTDSKGNSTTNYHYLSCLIVILPGNFPELLIYREDWRSKIAQAFGYDDIDFESAEFSRAFCVRSKDKKFAFDVCNPQMMEYLLDHRDLNLEIEHNAIGLVLGKDLPIEKIEFNLERLLDIRSRLPDYLFTQ